MENYYPDELQHWGIKGQKWGVRRYQNKDGTLTPAGQKRYNKEMERLAAEEKILKNRQRTAAKIAKLETKQKELEDKRRELDELEGKPKKLTREEKAAEKAARKEEKAVKKEEKAAKKEAEEKIEKAKDSSRDKDLKKMSNEEIQARIDRIKLEQSLKNLTEEKKDPNSNTSKGQQVVKEILTDSAKMIGKQAGDYLLGVMANKVLESVEGDKKAVDPKLRQKKK